MKRQPANLSESLHQRLNSYALAASAAGVGILALALPAEAKIIYSKTDKLIAPHQSLNLDLDRDGKTDFKISNGATCATDMCWTWLSAKGVIPSNGVQVGGYDGVAAALKPGSYIGPNRKFSYAAVMLDMVWGQTSGGYWAGVNNRYLGLKFQIHGQPHYGWARMNVDVTREGSYTAFIAARLTGYAYETIPNKLIIAGKTHGKGANTLHGAGLRQLARGASAIPASRAKQ